MQTRPLTRIGGAAPRPKPSLRLLVALLVMLQLAGPTGYALADPAPVASSHQEHIGAQDDFGCEPFHDEAFCGSCSVLSTQPLRSCSGASPGMLLAGSAATMGAAASPLPDGSSPAPVHARAPPRS